MYTVYSEGETVFGTTDSLEEARQMRWHLWLTDYETARIEDQNHEVVQ